MGAGFAAELAVGRETGLGAGAFAPTLEFPDEEREAIEGEGLGAGFAAGLAVGRETGLGAGEEPTLELPEEDREAIEGEGFAAGFTTGLGADPPLREEMLGDEGRCGALETLGRCGVGREATGERETLGRDGACLT